MVVLSFCQSVTHAFVRKLKSERVKQLVLFDQLVLGYFSIRNCCMCLVMIENALETVATDLNRANPKE